MPHARLLTAPLFAILIAAVVAPMAGGIVTTLAVPATPAATTAPVAALPGYQVSLFAVGAGVGTNPDPIVSDAPYIYVAYQNDSAKDGSTAKPSTIVQYTADGAVAKTFSIAGHCDGLRVDPATHLLWATVNEDAKALLYTINPLSGTVETYQFSVAPHGGGYDDLAFVNGKAFVAASNPTFDASGANVFPAIDSVTLVGSTAKLTPVLLGNASAADVTTKTTVAINAVDPDSFTVDPSGNLVLVDQGGTELVTIQQPGAAGQSVTRLAVGTQLDDTAWATANSGRLFVVDAARNAIYVLTAAFVPNAVYTETPSDSGVAGLVGTIDPASGIVAPIAIGFGKPTGLLFVPN